MLQYEENEENYLITLTCSVPVVIFVPPEPPVTNFGSFVFESTTIVGDIEETGRLPGATKLIGLGGTPKSLSKPGVLKLTIKI